LKCVRLEVNWWADMVLSAAKACDEAVKDTASSRIKTMVNR